MLWLAFCVWALASLSFLVLGAGRPHGEGAKTIILCFFSGAQRALADGSAVEGGAAGPSVASVLEDALPPCGCGTARLAPSGEAREQGHLGSPHPYYQSLNIASGFSLEAACLREGQVLRAASTVDARFLREESGTALSAENLQFLRERSETYKNVRHAAACFQSRVHAFVNPQAKPFPNQVAYPKCCPRGLCAVEISHIEKQFLADTKAILAKCSSRFGAPGPVALAKEDLILAIFLHRARSAPADDVIFFSLPAASMRSGHHEPTQTLVKWTPSVHASEMDSCLGLRLTIAFSDFVEPKKKLRAPLHKQSTGAMVHFTEHELARYIMQYFNDDNLAGKAVSVDQYVVRRVLYDDVSLSQVGCGYTPAPRLLNQQLSNSIPLACLVSAQPIGTNRLPFLSLRPTCDM
jgi:hypothetical protein